MGEESAKWRSAPGCVRRASRGEARLYDAARPVFHSLIGKVVEARLGFWARERAAGMAASRLTHRLEVGRRVAVEGYGPGILMYVGSVPPYPVQMAGVAFPDPVGNSDGVLGAARYFHCPPQHGLFIPTIEVTRLWHNTPLPSLPKRVIHATLPSQTPTKAERAAVCRQQLLTARKARLKQLDTTRESVLQNYETIRTAAHNRLRAKVEQSHHHVSTKRKPKRPPPTPVASEHKLNELRAMWFSRSPVVPPIASPNLLS